MPGVAGRISLGMDVAAQDHQGLDCFGHEGCGLVRVGEGVRPRPRGLGAASAGWIDLGLDHAGVAVVDGAKDGDRPSVPPCVAHEQLSRCRSRGLVGGGVSHGVAAAAL